MRGGDVDRAYLGGRKEVIAEILSDGHFEINRLLRKDELKMKKTHPRTA